MNWSRILAALSATAVGLTFVANQGGAISSDKAVWLLAVAGAINVFTERLQGGKGKAEPFRLTSDEIDILRIHREKERQREEEAG